ncbi:MBL fold metallo-hydrolase [Paenibacillus sp. GCM10027626]|uniref:MBL fold metallo-hydrolase n=1 Tax=Paenibacillus sp. GCM10027626 TaxID=3273411 RepID=UPI003632A82E
MEGSMQHAGGTEVTFWGTGDSMGVPRVYCDCAVCTEARRGGSNRRTRSLVHLSDPSYGTMLIDCGPDWRSQMEAANMRHIDKMLLTHAHFDHIAGLAEWADSCRWLNRRGEAYAKAEVIAEIVNRFPWLERNIAFKPIDEPFNLGAWKITCWKVNHGKNGISFAFRFDHEAAGKAWVYCPDAINLTPEQLAPMHDLQLLILGASFYQEPYPMETRSVYDVTEACELFGKLQPERMLLTHMSHDIDIRRDYSLPAAVSFAKAGLQVVV